MPSERVLLAQFESNRLVFGELVRVLDDRIAEITLGQSGASRYQGRQRLFEDDYNRLRNDPDYLRLAEELGILGLRVDFFNDENGHAYHFRLTEAEVGWTMYWRERGIAYFREVPSGLAYVFVPSVDGFERRHSFQGDMVYQQIEDGWYLFEAHTH